MPLSGLEQIAIWLEFAVTHPESLSESQQILLPAIKRISPCEKWRVMNKICFICDNIFHIIMCEPLNVKIHSRFGLVVNQNSEVGWEQISIWHGTNLVIYLMLYNWRGGGFCEECGEVHDYSPKYDPQLWGPILHSPGPINRAIVSLQEKVWELNNIQ